MRPARGFSLLEVLVAVALFALAMGLAYGGLDAVVRGRAQLQQEAQRLASLQLAVGQLERDVRAALPRSVRTADLRREPALLVERDALTLTRAGYANGLAQARAELERVRWGADRDALVRWRFVSLDRGGSERPVEALRLTGVSAWRVEALQADGRWVDRWPPPGQDAAAWPRALRLGFDLHGVGRIERLLELSEAPR
jgi:general secretion pathway protein J